MEKSAGLGACRARALPDLLGLLAAELGLASLLGLLGLLTLGYQLTLVIDINAYLFIAVAVTSLFSHYLLIVVLVIYSLLKMAAEKGVCWKRKRSKTGSLSLLTSFLSQWMPSKG